ncbi:MAG: hypothetical protein WCF78_03045 [archaeon]
MSDDYKVDYDELQKIYRLETKSPKLSRLDSSFYKALKKFLTEERNKYISSFEDSFSTNTLKRFENLKRITEKIREIRIKKIMNMCLMYSRTNDFADEGLVDFEIDFAKGILKLIDKQNEQTNTIFGLSKKSQNVDTTTQIKVKFLQDIPAFIGGDMKEYGPFDTGQVVEIPEDIFKILETKEIIEKVD